MLRAIKEAAGYESMTYGLRVIRRFEKVNGIAFDPLDDTHVSRVSGWGGEERFFRQAKKVLKP